MMKKLGALVFSLLLLAMPAQAWNNKGHMAVAYIAYAELDKEVRKKLDKLLESHPDFQRLTAYAGPSNGDNYHVIIFMNAATWPDSIRDDPRFYDETDPDSLPTPKIAGFPTMMKLKPWHYIDLPFSTDGSATTGPYEINALKSLRALRHALNNPSVPSNNQAYFLAWILHIGGDVHQPLHCTSRFTQKLSPPNNPDGDRGGNGFKIQPFPLPEANYSAESLHSFWDGVLGVNRDILSVSTLAKAIAKQYPKPNSISTDEELWIQESFSYAKASVYTINENEKIPDAYFLNAQRLARQRIAIAGYRLAKVLNEKFK
jgi:hypothetical protein